MDRKFNEPMLSFSLPKVALRKESVDRKILCPESAPYEAPSLSARRAWIEKTTYLEISSMEDVALRKESVDRKDVAMSGAEEFMRRSPQGERG